MLAAVRDKRVGRLEVEVEVAAVGSGHRFPQLGSAGGGGVTGLPRFDGPDSGFPDAPGGIEVRLTGGEVHHVHPRGPEGDGLRHDGEGGRGRDGGGAVGEAQVRRCHREASSVRKGGMRPGIGSYAAGIGVGNRSARRSATGSGTNPRMSPPRAAISLMSFELT